VRTYFRLMFNICLNINFQNETIEKEQFKTLWHLEAIARACKRCINLKAESLSKLQLWLA